MVFLLIVPSVMILVVVLLHETAKYFGVKISYAPLTICAVLSFVIDVVAAEISTVPGREYFLKLFGLIFVAATVVTAINLYLEVKK